MRFHRIQDSNADHEQALKYFSPHHNNTIRSVRNYQHNSVCMVEIELYPIEARFVRILRERFAELRAIVAINIDWLSTEIESSYIES